MGAILVPGHRARRAAGSERRRDPCTGSAARSTARSPATIIEDPHARCPHGNHERVLRACEATIERLATDRHYFAHPARTLFKDIRVYFPMNAQLRVLHVIERYLTAPTSSCAASPRTASTSTATRCSAAPAPARARRASACRCRTTATARRTSTWPRPRRSSRRSPRDGFVWGRADAPCMPRSAVLAGADGGNVRDMLLGVDVGGTFTDAVLALRRPAHHRQGADHARRPVRGRAGRGRGGARARPARAPTRSRRSRTG